MTNSTGDQPARPPKKKQATNKATKTERVSKSKKKK